MLREKLMEKSADVVKGFRMRGMGEVSRIEALSDAVFGFAITLLVVSLEVPQTFSELMEAMHGFIAFAVSFVLLFNIWLTQYRFFRRYGLNDSFTIWMTALLLFVVLFYVYPLKFLWTFLVNLVFGFPMKAHAPDGSSIPVITREQIPTLMTIFGLGYAAVFLIFALLYFHAYRKRAPLRLSELEIHDTWNEVSENTLHVLIGLLSVVISLVTRSGLGGMAFWLIAPVMFVNGVIMSRRRRKIEQRLEASAATT